MAELPTIEQLEAEVEAKWERDRVEARGREARREQMRLEAIRDEAAARKRGEENFRKEREAEKELAAKAHAELYGGQLAAALDPGQSYDLIYINSQPWLTGWMAFTSTEAATAAKARLQYSVLYVSPENGARGISGVKLGTRVPAGTLIAVDPSVEELDRLVSEVKAQKDEKQKHTDEVRQREREQAEAERNRKHFGAPVT